MRIKADGYDYGNIVSRPMSQEVTESLERYHQSQPQLPKETLEKMEELRQAQMAMTQYSSSENLNHVRSQIKAAEHAVQASWEAKQKRFSLDELFAIAQSEITLASQQIQVQKSHLVYAEQLDKAKLVNYKHQKSQRKLKDKGCKTEYEVLVEYAAKTKEITEIENRAKAELEKAQRRLEVAQWFLFDHAGDVAQVCRRRVYVH